MSTVIVIPTIYLFFVSLIYKYNKKKEDFFLNFSIYSIYCISFFFLIIYDHDLISNDVIDFYEKGQNFDLFTLSLSAYLGYLFVFLISLISKIFINFENVFFFIISINSINILLFIKILNYLQIGNISKLLLTIFIFLNPIFILILSSGHREIIEITLILILIYSFIQKKNFLFNVIIILMVLILLIFVHKTYILGSASILFVYFILNMKKNLKIFFINFMLFFIVCLFIYLNRNAFLNEIDFFNSVTGNRAINIENIWQFIEDYRKKSSMGSGYSSTFRDARTLYEGNNSSNIIFYLSSVYFNYLLSPLINISKFINNINFSDYVYIMHIMLRIISIISIFIFIKYLDRKILTVLSIFIILTIIWSLGTTSYGTAIRHNIVSDFSLFLSTIMLFKKAKF